MSLLIIILMPHSTNHHSKLIQLYYGHNLLMEFHYLCLLFLILCPSLFLMFLSHTLPCLSYRLLSSPLLPFFIDVTQVSAVQPVSLPPRPSRLSSLRVSPALASPPTTASPPSAGPRSVLDVGSLPAARPWSSTETAGDTWSPLRWTVRRPGNRTADKEQDRECESRNELVLYLYGHKEGCLQAYSCTSACARADLGPAESPSVTLFSSSVLTEDLSYKCSHQSANYASASSILPSFLHCVFLCWEMDCDHGEDCR